MSKKKSEEQKKVAPAITRVMAKVADLKTRYTRETNPNHMTAAMFEELCSFITSVGFLDPPLAVKRDGELVIEDGHHRFWAAQKLGLVEIPVDVYSGDSDAVNRLIGVGMNHLRGDLDYAAVAELLAQAQLDEGFTIEELAKFSSLAADEVAALLEEAQPSNEKIVDDAAGAAPPEEKKGKAFVLEIEFASAAEVRLVRRRLRKASGAAKDLADGMFKVLGEDRVTTKEENDG